MASAGLVAIDWGTSALRAWRLGPDGAVLEARRHPWGILHLPAGGFAAAFDAATAGWEGAGTDVPAIACGMIGSRQGWQEVGYLPVPASLAGLAGGLAAVPAGAGRVLHVVPGLLDARNADRPDVMRGEETQALGAIARLGQGEATLLVMPGTHSKWVRLRGDSVLGFETAMTGELYAVLLAHSILGRDVPENVADPERQADAFRRGVAAARAHGSLPSLFSARALTLTGRLGAERVPDYLSGVLIGGEIMKAWLGPTRPSLVGDGALADAYATAFELLGHDRPAMLGDTALDGLRLIAAAAGLAETGVGRC